nr:hypothetical protein [uncultured Brevundimonas sp.]
MSDVIAEPTFEPPADALAFYEESLRALPVLKTLGDTPYRVFEI